MIPELYSARKILFKNITLILGSLNQFLKAFLPE
jgi:hypothetical protein